jgi:type I restriction enzyme R subunit
MSNLTTEQTFESAIIESLVLQGNYTQGIASGYSPELGLFKNEVITFLQQSQPKLWETITSVHIC